jgi:predicted transcriptional regulator
MQTLEHKGHVRHVQDGRAFRFLPVTDADEAGGTALRRILKRVYHGSRELMVSRLVEDKEVSPEEIRRIKSRLEERLKEMEAQ